MCRIACIVACCVLSWTVALAGDASTYLGSIDTNPVVPTAVVINPSNNKVYVGGSSGAAAKVKVINGANGTITELTIPDATAIPSMAYDPSTNYIYVATTSSRIGVIDCSSDSVLPNILLNSGSGVNNIEQIAVDPGFRLVLTGRDATKEIAIVSLPSGTGTFPTEPDNTCTVIAINSTTQTAYAAERTEAAANDIFSIDSAGTVATRITTASTHNVLSMAHTGTILFAGTGKGSIYFRPDGTVPAQGIVDFSTFPVAADDDLSSMAFNAVTNRLYVCNATSGGVYVVNTTLMPPTVIASIPVATPKSIAVNPNTNRVFVTSGTNTFVTINGATNSIVSFDSNSAATSISRLALNPVTNRVYATESANPKIHAYDGAVNTVVGKDGAGAVAAYNFSSSLMATNSTTGLVYTVEIPMGMQPTTTVYQVSGASVSTGTAGSMPVDIGINEISNKIYVANQGNSTVTRFDGTAFPGAKTIMLSAGGLTGQNPVALAVDPVVNRVFVANRGPGMGVSGNVSVIYGGSDEVIATLPVDGEPTAICAVPSRSKLYVATKQNDQGFVTVFSTLENKLIRKISVQESPQQLLPAGENRVYVSSLTSAAVQAIDTAGDNAIGGITCGNSNNIMAYNAANGLLYVVSRSSSGNLTAIDVNSNSTRQAPTSAGSSPSSIVVSPSGNRVYIAQQSGVITVLDGGVNPFLLAQVNSFNTQGLVNSLAMDTVRSKLYVAGIGFRSVDLESGLFDTTSNALTGPVKPLFVNNFPQFTLNVGTSEAVYYQLDSTQGAWKRETVSGTLTLSSVSAGSHTLYVYRSKDEDATLANFAQGSNTPRIEPIDAYPFIVHDGGLPLPTLNTIDDQVINEDQSQVSIDFFGVTPGPLDTVFNASNITFVTSNSNPVGLVSIVSPVDFDSTRGKGTLKITPTANLFGDVFVTVRVTDPTVISGVPASQLTVTRTFKLTVQPVNDAPTFNVGANITVSEAAVESTTAGFISGIVLGPANESTQTVSQYIVTAAQPDQFKVQPSIDNTGTLKFTPANNSGAATPVSINVQLKDSGGTTNSGSDTSAVKTFTITLTPIADTLIVMNTSDNGAANSNSLRDCMTRARAGDTITFDANIFDLTNSNAATVINVTGGGLPTLNDGNVTIEASDRRVTINGSGTVDASGILIGSSNNTIRGLSIVGFPGPGLRIQGGASNIIGGSRTSGTGPNGQGLRISGNGSFGFEIRGATSTANLVKGCWIGLDAAGTSAEANLAGILIQDGAAGNTIGGSGAGEANVIGGNKFEGTTFSGTGTDDNIFVGNEVGIAAVASTTSRSSSVSRREDDSPIASRSAIGNGSAGLFLSRGTRGSRVGGDSDTDSNVVANNGGNGVEVRASGSRRNAAKKNRISKNKSGGIALFDNANDGITAPTFVSVTELTPTTSTLSRSAVRVAITGTASSTTGAVEIFNDSGSQGETFVTRATVSAGTWSTEVDVSDVLNITATLTDDNGNTSAFAVFGRSPGDDSATDTDSDGISDALETLAGTDPNSATSVPTSGGALIVDKLQIGLNFAKAAKDTLKGSIRLVLPTGFINTDAVIAVQFADSSESVTLTSKGAGPKGLVTVKLTGGSTTAAPANTGGKITYAIAKKTLLSSLQSAGLDNETTAKEGETLTIPVGIAITSGTTKTVYTGTVSVIYKATTGKTGKAKQSL